MTIATVRAQFQTFLGAVTGIASAPAKMPASIKTAELPLAYTHAGPGRWMQGSIGQKQQIRNMIVTVYVQPTAQGVPVEQGYEACQPILEAIGDAFLDDPTLSDVVSTLQVQENEMSDTGIIQLLFGKVWYHGFEITVPTKWRYT